MDPLGETKEEEAPKNLISTLPKVSGWSSNKHSLLYKYKEFYYLESFLKGVLKVEEKSSSELNLSPSDTLLCSAPKCGTTWLKALAFAISTRTRFDVFSPDHPLLTTFPHKLVPYIEFDEPRVEGSPLLSTHMPYTALPEAVLSSGCKMVYIHRDPKDAFVSLWHFLQKVEAGRGDSIPFEEAFDMFCKGISSFGPFWEHVLGYWKASVDEPHRVLVVKYEEMMKGDGVGDVRRIAEFMGCPFDEEEETRGVPARIVEMCSFGSLSELEVNKVDHKSKVVGSFSYSLFFRKAVVDDWKNHLTPEMAERLDQICAEKLATMV